MRHHSTLRPGLLLGLVLVLAMRAELAHAGARDDALAGLIALTKDSDPEVRRSAFSAVGHMGIDSAAVATAIQTALDDQDPGVRHAALAALVTIWPDATLASQLLTKAMLDQDGRVSAFAKEELHRMAGRAVPELIKALKQPESRTAALDVIARIGPYAADAAPTVTALLRDKEKGVRALAATSLGSIFRADTPAVRVTPSSAQHYAHVRQHGMHAARLH